MRCKLIAGLSPELLKNEFDDGKSETDHRVGDANTTFLISLTERREVHLSPG